VYRKCECVGDYGGNYVSVSVSASMSVCAGGGGGTSVLTPLLRVMYPPACSSWYVCHDAFM